MCKIGEDGPLTSLQVVRISWSRIFKYRDYMEVNNALNCDVVLLAAEHVDWLKSLKVPYNNS